MTQKHYPYDAGLEHRAAGSAAVTASANYTTIDQGVANANSNGKGVVPRTDYVTVIDATAVKVSAGDEMYRFEIQLSDDDFTTVNAIAGILELGDATQLAAAEDAGVGTYELMWTSEWNSTNFRYWRLAYVENGGTSPSITFSAYTSKRQ